MESVISNIIKHGLNNEDWKIRSKALQAIIPFINLDLSYTTNTQEMKRVLERVISLIKDTSAQVAESAKEVAAGLKDLCYDFSSVFSKLTLAYQQIFQEHCEQIRGSTILRNNFQRISETPQKSILENLEKPKSFAFQSGSLTAIASTISAGYLETNKNNLVFGFIPPSLMQQLEDQDNWRLRISAIQELESIVTSLDSFEEVMPYMAVLVRFLNKLLEDSNFKISISTLNILREIICVQGASQQSNIPQVLPLCIVKLGDNKISVRQCTFKTVLSLFRNCRSRNITSVILPQLCEALGSSNWHIREEVLMILLASMLDNIEYDYMGLVPHFAKLLDDQKNKIRYAATEALAVIAQKGQAEVIARLKPIVDDLAMAALMQRFQFKALPLLNEDYVEFPKAFPNSAPVISSPYITAMPFNRTIDIGEISKANETSTPSTLNSSFSPFTVSKFKRLRPSSESNFTEPEESEIKTQKKIFVVKNDKPVVRLNYPGKAKQGQERPPLEKPPLEKPPNLTAGRLNKEEQVSRAFQSSPVLKPRQDHSQAEDQPIYLAVEELKRVPNCEDALQKCIVAGSLDNWSDQFEALNMLRRLLKHHSELFVSHVTLHNICLDLIKWADSLRSSLSKNALIVIGEMCENLGRTIDSEINELMKVVIKKSIDTNIFLSEQAEVAIESMCKYCNENKLASSLLGIAQTNKNPLTRAKVAYCLSKVFHRMRFNLNKFRDLDKLLIILSEYLSDAAFDVRNNSKEAIVSLSDCFPNEIELEKTLSRCLNDQNRKKILEAIQSKPLAKLSSPIKRSAHRELRSTSIADNSRNTRNRSIGYSAEIPELEAISKLSSEMSSAEWKVRYASIGSLQELVAEHSDSLKASAKLLSAVDVFCKGLGDSNLKVHIHTLNALIKAIPSLGKALEPHLGLIVNALLPGLGSANSSIREIARDVMNAIVQNCEAFAVMVPLTAAVGISNSRSKAAILTLITEILPRVYDKKPSVVSKNVVPLLGKILGDSKGNVREESARLVVKLYQVMNTALFECIPNGTTQKVLEILNEGM